MYRPEWYEYFCPLDTLSQKIHPVGLNFLGKCVQCVLQIHFPADRFSYNINCYVYDLTCCNCLAKSDITLAPSYVHIQIYSTHNLSSSKDGS